MRFESEYEVRYSETDAMGIVYHANYFSWFDAGRTRLLQAVGFPYKQCEDLGYFAPVIHAEIDYGTPFTYGETAVLVTRVSKVTPVKITYSYEIYDINDDREVVKPHITGATVHCLVDRTTFRPVSTKKVLPELYQIYKEIEEA